MNAGSTSPYSPFKKYPSINELDYSNHYYNNQGIQLDESDRKEHICEKFQAILLCSAAKHGEEQEVLKLILLGVIHK